MAMTQYVAKRFQQSHASLSLDTDALGRYNDVIDLSIGDTDYVTDRRIIDAAYRDACAGHTHYGDPKGDPELIDAICAAWREDFGQTITPKEVLVTTSSCMGMAQVMLGLLNPGDEVIVFGPYFSIYKQQIELAGGKAVEIVTREADGYLPKEADIRAAVTERTRAFIVNSPCNPTGASFDRPALEMLARLAREYDLLAIADEIYTRYLYDGAFVPMRTITGMADRTVTLNSFSKNFMMTGWRVGCIIAHPDLIQAFHYVNGGLTYSAPSVSQRAAIEALKLRRDIQEQYISQYKARVYYAADCIEQMPYLTLLRPRGTFYLFPGIGKTGLTDSAFCQQLLEKAHIMATPGGAFGQAGQGHFRIACTVSMEKIREAMERMTALAAFFPNGSAE